MNSVASPQSADSANLPINKKAKAVQKRLATENTVEAIQQKRSAAIRHCFEMYSTGSCSFINLADYLNESGFVSRSGRAFRDDTLRSMLENPIYIGIIEYQGTKKETYLTYKGKHQP